MAKKQSIIKPALPEPTKTDRSEISLDLLAERLGETAEALQAVSNLLYHYQDKFQNDPLIVGVQNIVQAIAEDWAETADKLWKGGAQ